MRALFCCARFVICACCIFGSEHVGDANEMEEARKFYDYLTKPIPECRITAIIETHEPAWTREQIEDTITKHGLYEELRAHPEAKDRIEKQIAREREVLLRGHSGTNRVVIREWVGPRLYRKDELFEDGSGVTNYFKGSSNVKYTWVNIHDREFSDVVSWRGNPPIKSGSISQARTFYKMDNLWQVMAIEPELAFGFMLVVKEGRYPPDSNTYWPPQSYSSFRSRLNLSKLRELLAGENANFFLSITNALLEGMECKVFRFESRMEVGNFVSYWFDERTVKNLLFVEAQIPSKSTSIRSMRRNHDTNGVPREVMFEGVVEGENVFKKITVLLAELNPNWDLIEAFKPLFPGDYIVQDESSGVGRTIQTPRDTPEHFVESEGRRRGGVISRTVTLFFGVSSLFLFFLIYSYRKRRSIQ